MGEISSRGENNKNNTNVKPEVKIRPKDLISRPPQHLFQRSGNEVKKLCT